MYMCVCNHFKLAIQNSMNTIKCKSDCFSVLTLLDNKVYI